ncbi:MAG: isoprenylcysteine carboxylmethyltransferase family protein [Chloroflexi bacterium]|nr:isoprenylcysteine carboxylmethyltransferase family protein [Chloroflexota bacterium]
MRQETRTEARLKAMAEELAALIFQSAWLFLVLVAVVAALVLEDVPKGKIDPLSHLPVILPFLFAFGSVYIRDRFGSYGAVPPLQIAGAVIIGLGISGYLASLLSLGRNWSFFASVKKDHRLVTRGPYRYVRHPIYSSMMLVFLGSGLLISNYLMLLLTPLVVFLYFLRARLEERLLAEEFPEYAQHVRQSGMFLPRIS